MTEEPHIRRWTAHFEGGEEPAVSHVSIPLEERMLALANAEMRERGTDEASARRGAANLLAVAALSLQWRTCPVSHKEMAFAMALAGPWDDIRSRLRAGRAARRHRAMLGAALGASSLLNAALLLR